MERARRARMSWSQKAELWRRWRAGESLSEIGRALERLPASVFSVLRSHGGREPSARRRSRLALSTAEREEISRGIARGASIRAISRHLQRAPSTVSREIRRNGGARAYRAARADRQAWRHSRRPRPCRLATRPALRALVAEKLALKWSPQQIAGWLRVTCPSDPERHVSHETIYRSLFVQSRGVLKRALLAQLRRGRSFRHSRHATTAGQTRGACRRCQSDPSCTSRRDRRPFVRSTARPVPAVRQL
jgi:IS30 family transposase